MKTYIIITFIILSNYVIAQKPLDTIYANESKNVTLFFPDQIRQGITGSENFVFTYNREKLQHFGLLQATPGDESNLLAITNDGKVYAYILKYAAALSKLNYFISDKTCIGNEKPIMIVPKRKLSIDTIIANKNNMYKNFGDYLLKFKYHTIASKRKKGMVLRLKNKLYHNSEVYLVFEIKNNSGIDFEIDFLNVYRTNGNKKRKASFQKLQLHPIYKYKLPYGVIHRHAYKFVYVMPKFVLGNHERLQIELKELKGSRSIILKTRL
mgnify:FL=1|tara:strand:+ start:1162 stop:1962 length:801 start_codon:yes stop_codon:yes gene_type:complete